VKKLFIFCIFLTAYGCSFVQKSSLLGAYEALDNYDCETVYQELNAADKYAMPGTLHQAEISFLRASCLERENVDEALVIFSNIVEQFPDTEYAERAQDQIHKANLYSPLNMLSYVPPIYPVGAGLRGINGKVEVEFTIQKDGTVADILIINAEPKLIFNNAVIQAVQQWRFNPRAIENQLTEQKARQVLYFKKMPSNQHSWRYEEM